MKKKIALFMVSVLAITSTTNFVGASEVGQGTEVKEELNVDVKEETVQEEVVQEEIKEEMLELEEKYDGLIIKESENYVNDKEENVVSLDFENVEEFEKFIQDRESNNAITDNTFDLKLEEPTSNQMQRGIKSGSTTVRKWVPLSGYTNIFTWVNARINYNYDYNSKGAYFVRGTGASSYSEGFYIGGWNQTYYNQTISSNKKNLTTHISGYWRATISVAGIPFEMTESATYKFNVYYN